MNQYRAFSQRSFREALATLDRGDGGETGEAETLLAALIPGVEREHGRRLLRLGSRLSGCFALGVPSAPGLVFCGAGLPVAETPEASTRVISVGGIGENLGEALRRCLGEAAETLAQRDWRGVRSRGQLPAAGQPVVGEGARAYLPGWRLDNGRAVALALAHCVGPVGGDGAAPPSSGCAAGADRASALLHGCLERLEHDAVALWWYAGVPAHRLADSTPAALAVQARLGRWRGGLAGRPVHCLLLPSVIRIPTVVAFSTDPGEGGFACGMAARPRLADALLAACRELCQMELGLWMLARKIEHQGVEGLSGADGRQWERARAIDPRYCPALLGDGPAPDYAELPDISPAAAVETIGQRLAAQGIPAYGVDLSHPDNPIPVLRAIAPALQPASRQARTPRLAQALDRHGGAWGWHRPMELY